MMLLVRGDARHLPFADGSVQTCITSPPYWGLRDYGTATWEGGDAACDHIEHRAARRDSPGGYHNSRNDRSGASQPSTQATVMPYRSECGKCGAVRVDAQLGLERTPDEYVQNMVAVFREVWRVLRPDGTCWLNLGDSYASGEIGRNDDDAANLARRAAAFGTGRVKDGRPHERQQRRVQTGLKPKDLVGIPWRVAFALQADGWYLRSDIIWAKCLSGGAVVYARTQKGDLPMTVKDMVRLDPATVQLWDGRAWNQAVSWEASPAKGDGLELELRNGARIGCTPEHRWPTTRGLVAASELKVGDQLASCRLPQPSSLRDPAYLPDDDVGWFVGLYIAEGSQSEGTIQIASHASQDERFRRVAGIARAFDGYAAVHYGSGHAATVNVNAPVLLGVLNAYVSGRTAHDKHLSPRCWKRSDQFLTAVLNGYLSGDGHLREGGRWVLGFCDNDAVACDLRVLAARIGGSLRLRRTQHQCNGSAFPGWRGSFYFNPAQRKRSDYEIVAIRRSRARMFWDISLASEPHTFALDCGVLTHNSNPMPESVTDRCTKSHEYIFLLSKAPTYYFDADAVKEAGTIAAGTLAAKGSVERKAVAGVNARPPEYKVYDGLRNIRSVWNIATQPYPGAHFATMPEKLVERCVLAGSKSGDIVLDPFMGSGTVARVALRLGRRAMGCDLNPAYLKLADDRTRVTYGLPLSDDVDGEVA
jgi:DNA modification methylase